VLKATKPLAQDAGRANATRTVDFGPTWEAQVAESQLVGATEIISSSVQNGQAEPDTGTSHFTPAVTTKELEQSERAIDNQCQQLLYAISRMNGAKAVLKSLAKKRLFFSSRSANGGAGQERPGLAHLECGRSCASKRTPWRGTPVATVPA